MTRAYQAMPERADLLVVSAHPDDEIATFGAIIPYCLAHGRSVVAACLTRQADMELAALREGELRASLWTCGMRHEPVLASFPDCGFIAPDRFESLEWVWTRWGGRATVAAYVAGLYRRFRPRVVFSHHPETGEYGHPNHQAAGWACLDAHALLAGDAAQPQKIYVGDPAGWRVDWHAPLPALGGRSAAEVGAEALRCHRSQSCSDAGVRAHLAFRAIRSQVGEDAVCSDIFENCHQREDA